MMKNKVILINKQENISSNATISQLKRKLGIKKIGFAGTLDPFACGLLVVFTNKATKLADMFHENHKEYIATLQFGSITDTLDNQGQVIKQTDKKVSKEQVLDYFAKINGQKIWQTPPDFSAKKVDGVRAYKLARENKEVKLKDALVEIKSITMLDFDEAKQQLVFHCIVSKGTYIRSLAKDIAANCQNLGHLIGLQRTSVNGFTLSQAQSVEELSDNSSAVVSIYDVLAKLKTIHRIVITDQRLLSAINNGATYNKSYNNEYIEFVHDDRVIAYYKKDEKLDKYKMFIKVD